MNSSPSLLQALSEAVEYLEEFGLSYAVVGAIAVGARSEPRFTRDVDLAVSVDSDEHSEKFISFLISKDYELRELFQQKSSGEIITCRMAPRNQAGIMIDFLFKTSGIEPEIVREAEIFEVSPGQHLSVAKLGHLVAMKILSRRANRPQDEIDLKHLINIIDSTELELARKSIALITTRKKNENRDLESELAELINKYENKLP